MKRTGCWEQRRPFHFLAASFPCSFRESSALTTQKDGPTAVFEPDFASGDGPPKPHIPVLALQRLNLCETKPEDHYLPVSQRDAGDSSALGGTARSGQIYSISEL
jgi:hypothetical protein